MGIFKKKNCSSCTPTSANASAPNPEWFIVLGTEQIGNNVVAKIKYIGCTNFEGIKICVYRGVSCSHIREARMLDPHFAKSGLSPFARFEPTHEGEEAARKFAQSL